MLKNWHLEMKRIFLILLICLVSVGTIAQADEHESDPLDAYSAYELVKMYQEQQGPGDAGLPEQASFLASAKINLIVGADTVGVVMDGGAIESVNDGAIDDPTIEFKTSWKYFKSVINSERPLKRITFGLRQGFIMKRSHGIGGRSKDKVMERALEKMDTEEPKAQKRVLKRLSAMAEKRGEKFMVEGRRAGLSKTSVEITGSDRMGEQEVEIIEFTGYTDEAPMEMGKMDMEEGEKSLGVYVKIEVEDADEVTIKIDYDEEELEYAMLDEDTLAIRWFNEETGKWMRITQGRPAWVKEVGVNTDENYVFAVLEHASVYGVAGDIIGVKKLEAMKGYEPAYFESPEEVERVRAEPEGKRGIVDRVIDFILGLVL